MAVRELHNDGVILVVEKPSGLPTQAPRGGGDNLYDRLRRRYPRLALHHRLDTPASGLVLFTLDPRANAASAGTGPASSVSPRRRAAGRAT